MEKSLVNIGMLILSSSRFLSCSPFICNASKLLEWLLHGRDLLHERVKPLNISAYKEINCASTHKR